MSSIYVKEVNRRMNTQKKVLLAGFAITAVASAGMFANSALAQGGGALDGLASKLATKFNLDQNTVKDALAEFREAKITQRENKFMDELNKATAQGDLTAVQKEQILQKRQQIKGELAQIKAVANKSERHQAFHKLHLDVKAWANQNDIPLRWLRASAPEHHLHLQYSHQH
jgi:hypothetical protein